MAKGPIPPGFRVGGLALAALGWAIVGACSSSTAQQRICSDSTYQTGTEPASAVSLTVDCTFQGGLAQGGAAAGMGGPGSLTNCNTISMEIDFVGGNSAFYDGGSAFQTQVDGGLAVDSAFQPAPIDGGTNESQFLIPLPAAAPPLDDGSLPQVQLQIPYGLAMAGMVNLGDGNDPSSCWGQGQCAGLTVTSAPSGTASSGGYSLGEVSGGTVTITSIGESAGSQVTLQISGATVNPPSSNTEAVCSDGKIHYLP